MSSTHSSISAEALKSPEQLEQEIDQQRDHIDRLIDEVELRLTPQGLLDQALAYAREKGGMEMAQRLGQTLKANPLPLALTTAGLAWLALEQTRQRAPAPQDCRPDDHETLAEALENAKRSLDQGGSNARETLQDLAARAERLSESVKRSAGQVDEALHKRPWAFAAAGLAIGAVAAILSNRKRTPERQIGDAYDLAEVDDEQDKAPFRPGAV